MKIEIKNNCEDYTSYRAARVKSLFNVESGANFNLSADLPVDDSDWQIGVIVGPSGSGKTSIGREFWADVGVDDFGEWPKDTPIIDAIAKGGEFDKVTSALSSVGLGSVPAWLRPYSVLSNGEKFRANIAKVISEAPERVIIDEFTSVVDRQTAKTGAAAFAKGWRRTSENQCLLLTPHYDIIDWVEPDWIFDTASGKYAGRGLWRRPKIELEIYQTNWSYWKLFEPHHYLKAPPMIAGFPYVGTVEGEPVAHCGVSTRPGLVEARMARIVVMPEWQGAGVGTKFIEAVTEMWLNGDNEYKKPMTTLVNTSHPGLCAYFRKSDKWTQISAAMLGGVKKGNSVSTTTAKRLKAMGRPRKDVAGFGGHFRAIQGFRYVGGQSR